VLNFDASCDIYWIFTYRELQDLRKEVPVLFGLILQVFVHRKSGLFLFILQQMEHKICSNWPNV